MSKTESNPRRSAVSFVCMLSALCLHSAHAQGVVTPDGYGREAIGDVKTRGAHGTVAAVGTKHGL